LLQRSRGYNSAETLNAVERARELAEKTGQLGHLVGAAMSSWGAALMSGGFADLQPIADEILDLAQRDGSRRGLFFGHYAKLVTCFLRGDSIHLEEHFAEAGQLIDAETGEMAIQCLGFAGLGALKMGYCDRARARLAQVTAYARDHNEQPYIVAAARHWEAILRSYLGEPQKAEQIAIEALEMCDRHGFSVVRDLTLLYMGWAKAELGLPAEAVSLIRRSIEGAGQSAFSGAWLTVLAHAETLAGALESAAAALESALAIDPECKYFRPHALICRGDLRLKTGNAEHAEADFREAIALAETMNQKMYELRAAIPLARLLRDTNRRDEARELLAAAYAWFTEGFDTADLKDAKSLLDELSA
jgi:tetratricopeptide (TPR) repeat protein